MGVIDDVRKWLQDWADWKRIKEQAEKVPALEKRIADLEAKLGGKQPGDVCKACGARALRMVSNRPSSKGYIEQRWECGECKRGEWRHVK